MRANEGDRSVIMLSLAKRKPCAGQNFLSVENMVRTMTVPENNEIGKHPADVHVFDAFELPVEAGSRSALEIYIDTVAKTQSNVAW